MLRRQIQLQLDLTASAGVGPNKFIAKVASDIRKPNGLTTIKPSQVLDFVAALPVERFWGVGPATAKKLHAHGLLTGADIRRLPLVQLAGWFGNFGIFLHGLAEGRDSRVVSPDRPAKSRGSETTFSRDVLNLAELEATLKTLAEEVADSLAKLGRGGRTVTLKVKYADFSSITRSRSLETETSDAATIFQTACLLLRSSTNAGQRPACDCYWKLRASPWSPVPPC